MTTDIFCCSYGKDAPWLEFLLRSIERFATGFRQTVVVYPTRDIDAIKPICDRFGFVKQAEFEEREDGHVHQTEIKTSCDLFSDADFFLHMDSDCVFIEPACPEDYLTDGKADIVYAHYDDPVAAYEGGRLPWKEITDRALGEECMYETMQRFPFMYPRWLFREVREHIERLHGVPFSEYVHTAESLGRAWHGYSEFCTLGAYAWLFRHLKFSFYDPGGSKFKPPHVKQFWSHSGLTAEERVELERIVTCADGKVS